MKIIDDFLDQDDFYELQTFMVGPEPALPWYYNSIIDSVDDVDKFQFTHLFYTDWVPISSSMKILNPILIKIDPIKLWRIKANLLTRTSNIVENEFHQDMGRMYQNGVEIDTSVHEKILSQITTSIFYVNTNNGYTKFEDGTKVESVANRLVTFPNATMHTGTSCTDEKTRVVINFNYFK